jgi:hypothetical protein
MSAPGWDPTCMVLCMTSAQLSRVRSWKIEMNAWKMSSATKRGNQRHDSWAKQLNMGQCNGTLHTSCSDTSM